MTEQDHALTDVRGEGESQSSRPLAVWLIGFGAVCAVAIVYCLLLRPGVVDGPAAPGVEDLLQTHDSPLKKDANGSLPGGAKQAGSGTLIVDGTLQQGSLKPSREIPPADGLEADSGGPSVLDSADVPETVPELFAEAEQNVLHLLERFERQPDALEIMARLQLLIGKSIEAQRYWEEALELAPNYAYAYDGLARVAADRGEYETAVELFRKSLLLQPALAETNLALPKTLVTLGRLDEAVEALERHLKLDPRSAEGHVTLGRVRLQRQEYEEAKQSYSAALALVPDNPFVHFGLGTACRRLNEMDAAKQHLETCKRLRAEERVSKQGRRDAFRTAAVIRPRVAGIYMSIGRLYVALGDLEEAERFYQRAGRMDEKNVDSGIQLAFLYFQSSRKEEALRIARKLGTIEGETPVFYLRVGVLYAQLDQLDEADEMLGKCRELAPNQGWPYRETARFYLKTNRNLPETIELSRRAVELEPSSANYAVLGDAHLKNQDRKAARAAYSRAAEIAPNNPQLLKAVELLKEPE